MDVFTSTVPTAGIRPLFFGLCSSLATWIEQVSETILLLVNLLYLQSGAVQITGRLGMLSSSNPIG